MKKKKNKKSIITNGNKELLKKYMSVEFGMQPYNAAIKAGYNDQFAKALQTRLGNKAIFGYTYAGIAEQEGWTPRKSLRKMIEKAGHVKGILPVQRVISSHTNGKADSKTNDFIEVPDEDLILKYENKLWEITGLKVGDDEINTNKNKPSFNLIINLNSGDSPQVLEIPK